MAFLYNIFDNPFARKALDREVIPNYIADNLKHNLRPYQEESFRRYIYSDRNDFEGKPNKPYHLLYNMATGSGKTLVMAGLILYLFEKGYRNFLFFVNSNNIIEKTKDNFLNNQASKYLFSDKIMIDGQEVHVKEIDNFDEADTENINIKFVSIQMLTSGLLLNVRENGLSFEDFEDRKLVLIGDEAHHNNADVWGDLVMKIHQMNYENVLLEFTATLDYDSREITEKYQDKVIQKYDLAQFRIDKYSKEINLIRSQYDEQERIIQALILNLYRQELAILHGINLKPVILFKARRTIKESEENKQKFHQLIDDFSAEMVDNIQKTSTVSIVQKAFMFFESLSLSLTEIAKRIKSNFKEENCLSANNDTEAELNQIRLNTLEDDNNPIRAIFAVQKLNEGWDVLNLFDIVRLYEGQNTGGSNTRIGKTTLSEAQLIGRGARYYPFALEEGQDKYTRKFDNDPSNDLKVLEELYYHTKEDSRYISELKKALIETGIYEDEDSLVTKQLTLKLDFKQTDFYKEGHVLSNKKVIKSFDNIKSFEDLGVKRRNYKHTLSSGSGKSTQVFNYFSSNEEVLEKTHKDDIKLIDIPSHIIRYSISQNPFFYFNNLSKYFPNVGSISNFIESEKYLGGIEITLTGTKKRLLSITNLDFLQALNGLLQEIEMDIKNNSTEYEGSDYISRPIHQVFKDKEIRVKRGSEQDKGQKSEVEDKSWYVYNDNYGTIEEKKFVELFSRRFEEIQQKFENIYLIRNERELKIYDSLGRAFEPDFLLFCKQSNEKEMTFQVFIEPKGMHLKGYDSWKEDFLKKIKEDQRTIKIYTDEYLITAVPFYNYEDENEFNKSLFEALRIK